VEPQGVNNGYKGICSLTISNEIYKRDYNELLSLIRRINSKKILKMKSAFIEKYLR
jgi:hypothetical protein